MPGRGPGPAAGGGRHRARPDRGAPPRSTRASSTGAVHVRQAACGVLCVDAIGDLAHHRRSEPLGLEPLGDIHGDDAGADDPLVEGDRVEADDPLAVGATVVGRPGHREVPHRLPGGEDMPVDRLRAAPIGLAASRPRSCRCALRPIPREAGDLVVQPEDAEILVDEPEPDRCGRLELGEKANRLGQLRAGRSRGAPPGACPPRCRSPCRTTA